MDASIDNFDLGYFRIDGKVAFVTGGNRGIGSAISVALAKAGADLFVLSRSDGGRKELEEAVSAAGRKVVFHTADIGDKAAVSAAVAACVREFGTIDVLVNNAGIQRRASVLEFSDEDWEDVIRVNLSASFYLSREAAKIMAARGSGKIINMASLLTFQGGLRVPAYAAAKHGIEGLTQSFSNELSSRNIQVNGIAPGYIDTEMNVALIADPKRSAEILGRIPANRWGKPADFMGAVVFLASRASDYVSGHVLVVDGGWMGR